MDRPAQSPGGIESLPWGSPTETRSSPISASRPELTLPVNTAASQPAGGIISGDMDLGSRSGGFGNQGAGDWPPALRWMSRLNDFFQRATGPVETFTTHTRQRLTGSRDGGLVVQQQHTYHHEQRSPTSMRQQQGNAGTESDPPLFGPRLRGQWMDGHFKLPFCTDRNLLLRPHRRARIGRLLPQYQGSWFRKKFEDRLWKL